MKKLAVKEFREVGLERLEEGDVVDATTGKVYRQETHELHEWELPSQTHGIERELRVIRILPNPRMVLCEYWELESRRTCVVNVGSNRKWTRGMRFVIAEPVGEVEFGRPWEYRGRAPRRRGRW